MPKIIQDKLRLTVASQGHSHLIQGKVRTMKIQHDQIPMFYHDQEPHRPSQIKLLCDGAESYRNIHDSIQRKLTSESKD